MGGIEGAGDLAEEVDDLPRLERPIAKPRLEVRALDVAHGDEQDAIDLAGLVDGQDVGVVDGRRHLRLALEAGPVVEVVRQRGRQDLERHAPLESALLRAIHDAHAAAPDDGLDAIRARGRCRCGGRDGAWSWRENADLFGTSRELALSQPPMLHEIASAVAVGHHEQVWPLGSTIDLVAVRTADRIQTNPLVVPPDEPMTGRVAGALSRPVAPRRSAG